MEDDNVIHLFEGLSEDLELSIQDVPSPVDEVFVAEDRVIIRTPDNTGMAMSPLQAKELAVRLIEAACKLEQY